MSNSRIKRIRTLAFGATETRLPYYGDEFHLISSSQELNIVFYDLDNSVIVEMEGFTYGKSAVKENTGKSFAMVGITSPNGACTPDFVVVKNWKFDSLQIAAVVDVNPATAFTPEVPLTLLAGVQQTIIAESRKRITLRADSANTAPVYPHSDGTKGVPIYPDEVRIIECSGALSFYCVDDAIVHKDKEF